MCHSLLSHWPPERHLSCSQVLAVMNKALEISVCRPLSRHEFSILSRKHQGAQFWDCFIEVRLTLWSTCTHTHTHTHTQTAFQSSCIIFHFCTNSNESSYYFIFSLTFAVVNVLDFGHSKLSFSFPFLFFFFFSTEDSIWKIWSTEY